MWATFEPGYSKTVPQVYVPLRMTFSNGMMSLVDVPATLKSKNRCHLTKAVHPKPIRYQAIVPFREVPVPSVERFELEMPYDMSFPSFPEMELNIHHSRPATCSSWDFGRDFTKPSWARSPFLCQRYFPKRSSHIDPSGTPRERSVNPGCSCPSTEYI